MIKLLQYKQNKQDKQRAAELQKEQSDRAAADVKIFEQKLLLMLSYTLKIYDVINSSDKLPDSIKGINHNFLQSDNKDTNDILNRLFQLIPDESRADTRMELIEQSFNYLFDIVLPKSKFILNNKDIKMFN